MQAHDYVDVLVPLLARMHHKRLAGYANLGFDVRAARKRAPLMNLRREAFGSG